MAEARKPHLGLMYNEEMLGLAWRLMCPQGKGSMSVNDIHVAVRVFFPTMSHTDFDQLVGSIKGNMTMKKLTCLLQHETLPEDFDPVLAAFRIFDRDHSGFLTSNELSHFVSQLPGVGQLNEEDTMHMMKLADIDGDGRVSLDDFKKFLEFHVLSPKSQT